MMKKIMMVVLLALVLPVQASQPGSWVTTAPTTGPTPMSYEWQLNINGSGWATMVDDPDPEDLTYPHTQPAGMVVQCRVRGLFSMVEPIVEGGLVVGVQMTLEPGPWSQVSEPNTYNETGGACGRPVRVP